MQVTEKHFQTWDGTRIFYRAWTPAAPVKHTVILFHRGHEHSGRWEQFVQSLAMPETAVFAWDQRGHGKSDGDRGRAPDLAAVVRDAEHFSRHLTATHGVRMSDTAVIASSLGAVVATAWVHDYAPPVRALVLAAAAFEVKLYVPLAIPFLRLKEKALPGGKVKSFVKSSMITAVPAEQSAYDRDPLIFKEIAVNLLLDLHDAGRRLVDDAGAITTPTLLLVAGRDWVVRQTPQFEFFRRLGSSVKQLEFYEAGRHALFHDVAAADITLRIRAFLKNCFADQPPTQSNRADLGGASRVEYDLLRTPSSLLWKAMRQWVRLGGLFSSGIRLGLKTGFDSGQSLDYVYANQAAGLSPVGKLVDRAYLDAIGWRGIRIRRTHLQELLTDALTLAAAEHLPLHVLDVAAGPGRYLLEVVRQWQGEKPTVELRDYKPANLEAAAALAKSLGVGGVTFTAADAFDRASFSALASKPSVVVVSGLYELFPDNEVVSESLAGIADAVGDRGYLVYTCQPWHPQVEFIARTLNNREGRPWVMRRRSQAEMDALVRQAGFEKIEQRIDRWGIFTVSLARRVGS